MIKRLAKPVFLLAVMALAACVPEQQYDQLEQLYQKLRSQLSADQAEITKLQGELKVTLKGDILFQEGSWQISPSGQQTLNNVAPTLAALKQTRIVVNGYTDNVPIGPQLRRMGITSNLDLSSKRADAVVSYLQARGVNPGLMSAQGFGDQHPVASNATPQGRAQNRRIEVTLVGPGN